MHGPFTQFAALLLICALAGAVFVRLREPVLILHHIRHIGPVNRFGTILAATDVSAPARLVVLFKHGQSAAEDQLLGSVSKHVLVEGGTDMLVSTAHTA